MSENTGSDGVEVISPGHMGRLWKNYRVMALGQTKKNFHKCGTHSASVLALSLFYEVVEAA